MKHDFNDERKFEEHPKFKGVRIAKLLTGAESENSISVSILKIAPGNEAPIHVHNKEGDSIYILSGNGTGSFAGEEKEVRAGDYIFVPHGIEHGIKNTSKEPLVLIATHSPPLF